MGRPLLLCTVVLSCATVSSALSLSVASSPETATKASAAPSEANLLVRAARGEATERTPVWLMRQAGRYMADFRAYSEKYPFRMRSETPEIATELSLQCWRAFGLDGVIMFSDILTPLPAMGVEFDVVAGRGPQITDTLRGTDRVGRFVREAGDMFDPASKLAFVGETLQNLAAETKDKTTLIGFVGAPWTLCAYASEGGASKHALHIKALMRDEPALAHEMLRVMAENIGDYALYQIDQGAEMIQVFESWAHQLTPAYFEAFAKPYANIVAAKVKAQHPDVPVLFFGNGGSSYLEKQRDMVAGDGAYDALSLDWAVDIGQARETLGHDVQVQGNLDPTLLLGSPEGIDAAVRDNIERAGGPGNHILNLGHGVLQPTPEANVAALVEACKKYGVRQ